MNSENSRGSRNEAETQPERRRRGSADKRRLLEDRLSRRSLMILALVFALVSLFLLVFPRSTVSQIEKRELATFPEFSLESYFSGAYTAGIATFYDDTVPYHDSFKNMGNQMKSAFGMKMFASAGTAAPEGGDSASDPDTDAASTPSPTPDPLEGISGREILTAFVQAGSALEEPYQRDFSAEENSTLDWVNNLMIINWDGHWRCMEPFGGGGGTAYANALNELQSKISSDVTIWSMPAPTSSAFYTPKNGLDYIGDQSACFDNIAAKLNPGIQSVNVVDVLKRHTEENIYCRTDHHWQPLGAYYAARTFAEAAGVQFADITNYESGANEGFVGTMYGFSQDSRILNDPERFEYYVPYAKYEAHYYDSYFNYQYSDDLFAEVDVDNSYLMFLGGDSWVVKVDTEVKNGRKLLVVKDSFGNAEIPYYTSSFEQIYVVDVREFKRNLVSFIDATGVTDVLFTMSAYSVVGDNAENITNLINQDAGSTIVDEHPTGSAVSGTTNTDAADSGDSGTEDNDDPAA